MNEPHLVTCSVCGKEFLLNDSTYRSRVGRHPVGTKFYCKEHQRIGRSEDLKLIWDNMSDEEKAQRKEAASERAKKQWASYDDAKRKEISKIFSEAQKQSITNKMANMTEEELAKYKEFLKIRAVKGIAGRTEEFYKKRSQLSKEMWANRTQEERDEVRRKQSEGLKRYLNSLSD